MTSKIQEALFRKMVKVIQDRKVVIKYDLMDVVGIDVAKYNSISDAFRYRNETVLKQVEYNKKDKTWIWRGDPIPEENVEKEEISSLTPSYKKEDSENA